MTKAVTKTVSDTHRIKRHALPELQALAWPGNPRRHDLESISGSLERFGYVQAIVIDDTSNLIVAGHGVLASLLIAHQDGRPLPERVTAGPAGAWQVPVVHVTLPEGEAQAYAISDTRTRELGGWDDARLIAVLQDLSDTELGLAGIGFTQEDLDVLLAKMDGELPASFNQLDTSPSSSSGSGPGSGSGDGGGDLGGRTLTCPHCGHAFTP